MKSVASYLSLLLICQIVAFSCKKDCKGSTDKQTINVTVQASKGYDYDLGSFGDEEGAIISMQAQHYETSTIDRINGVHCIYHYKPQENFQGTDEVELKSARGSDGASSNSKIVFTTIRFTIVK